MRAPLIRLGCLLSLLIASSASAVSMAWTPVANPGNACDSQGAQGCFGAVSYSYNIGTYEVTNAQYAQFLNAKAATDPLRLYSTSMGSGFGGITRTGTSGTYTYSAIAGREDMPVNYLSFFDALRFANWLNNGQGNGDTETGAYTMSNGDTVTRNPGATIFLPSEDEWYKAAYYDAPSASYFDYPAGSNAATTCASPSAAANNANCNSAVGDLTIRGSYSGSASSYGTFDQGGNVYEWTEGRDGSFRILRGGGFYDSASSLAASARLHDIPRSAADVNGFRVAMIPEPDTGLLVFGGLLGLAGWRRARA